MVKGKSVYSSKSGYLFMFLYYWGSFDHRVVILQVTGFNIPALEIFMKYNFK